MRRGTAPIWPHPELIFSLLQIAFLDLHGVPFELISVRGRVYFEVTMCEETMRILNRFWANDSVPVRAFCGSLKKLRRMVRDFRATQNPENRDVLHDETKDRIKSKDGGLT